MNGEKRRQEILEYIRRSPEPVSGTKLGQRFQVSRQVIVQDIGTFAGAEPGYSFHPSGLCISCAGVCEPCVLCMS